MPQTEYQKEWIKNNKEKAKATQKAWREKNKEKLKRRMINIDGLKYD